MDPLLKLLQKNARISLEEIAQRLDISSEEAAARISEFEEKGVIRGYRALINNSMLDNGVVRAIIEVRTSPTQDMGFDRIAKRIARFDQVQSMHLVSGGFDLLLVVKGRNLHEVALFVNSKLAAMEGVLSTSTHFMLKTYKDDGVLLEQMDHDERLKISP